MSLCSYDAESVLPEYAPLEHLLISPGQHRTPSTPAADVWSAACIVGKMLNQRSPHTPLWDLGGRATACV